MNAALEIGLRQYLLGRLTEEERERIDERLVTDSTFLEEVESAEDDLVEDYLEGVLSPAERERFEAFFLASPLHRQQLSQARTLRELFLSEHRQPSRLVRGGSAFLGQGSRLRRALKPALAGAAALLMAGTLWLLIRTPAGAPAVASVVLREGVPMGSGGPTVALTPSTDAVDLRMILRADLHDLYTARLTDGANPDGSLWQKAGLRPDGAVLTVRVQARLLQPGVYILHLSGRTARGDEPAGRYAFSVKR